MRQVELFRVIYCGARVGFSLFYAVLLYSLLGESGWYPISFLYILGSILAFRAKRGWVQAVLLCVDLGFVFFTLSVSGWMPLVVLSLAPVFAAPVLCGRLSAVVIAEALALDVRFFGMWYMIWLSHGAMFCAGYLFERQARLNEEKEQKERLQAEFREKLEIARRLSMEFAHEIKNPLMSISAALEVVSSMDIPERAQGLIEKAKREVERATRLTRDFARLEFSDAKRQRVSLRGLLEEVRREFEHLEVEVRCKEAELFGDGEALKRAFFNILQNSAEAGAERVEVTAEERDGRVLISFRDDGCGIDEEAREKVFMPFFTTKREGTGLGLAIVKSVVEAHGGRVRVGDRNTIEVELPLYGDMSSQG